MNFFSSQSLRKNKNLITILTAVYFVALLLLKFVGGESHVKTAKFIWIPFQLGLTPHILLVLLLNLISFIPMGVLIGLPGKNTGIYFAAGILFSLVVELLQAVLHLGMFDITTVLVCALGIVAGYFICQMLKPKESHLTYRAR